MITITFGNMCPRITITDDKTFEEVSIECRDYDQENALLIELVERLLKTEK